MYKILCFLLFIPVGLNAQPGTLDKSFANDGIALDSNITGSIHVLGLQSDGKIIAAGAGRFNDIPHILIRYNTDGGIDNGFGKDGSVGINELNLVDDVAIGPDDEIIVLGHIAVDIKLAKYKKDGTPDSAFGYYGSIITSAGADDEPTDLALQPDGKIVVCGYIVNEPNEENDGFLIRYMPDGSLDKSFGQGGIVNWGEVQGNVSPVSGLAILPSGQILVTFNLGGNGVARFNADGSRDLSFGKDGIAYFPSSNEEVKAFSANSLIVNRDGKIIGGGTAYNKKFDATKEYMAVSCLNEDGTKDSSFGNDGLQHIKKSDSDGDGHSVCLQDDGSIIVGGRVHDLEWQTFSHIAMARFNSNGAVDSAFGNNGLVITEIEGYAVANSTLLQKDGKILVGGDTYIGDFLSAKGYFLLLRYNNDAAAPPQTPITRIKRWLRKHGFTWENWPGKNIAAYSVQRSSNGINWTTIFNRRATGNLPGGQAGSQQVMANSSFQDPAPLNGTNYYRLQTTSTDGAVAYSNVIAITNDADNTVSISPNPARNNLRVDGLSSGKSKLTVVDLAGNIKLRAVANNTSYNLNIASLKAGNYLLKIEMNGKVVARKFVKE